MTLLSRLMQEIPPSPVIQMNEIIRQMRKEGRHITALNIGEPSFPTPEHIIHAAKKALDRNEIGYPPIGGDPNLKQAIITKIKRDQKIDIQPENIFIGNGSKQVIFNAFQATLNPGDEVLIPCPSWVAYGDIVRMCGGKPVFIDNTDSYGQMPKAKDYEPHITPKTKWIVINSPNNPTGDLLDHKDFQDFMELFNTHQQLMIMSDEIYEHLVYEPHHFISLLNYTPISDRILVINGVSKAYSMTSWRIGFGISSPNMIKALSRVQSQTTSGVCRIAQSAAAEALAGNQSCVNNMRNEFYIRQELIQTEIDNISGLNSTPMKGAFYAWINCSEWLGDMFKDDLTLAQWLLQEKGLAVTAGQAFGCTGYIRLSYAASRDAIKVALKTLNSVPTKLYQ